MWLCVREHGWLRGQVWVHHYEHVSICVLLCMTVWACRCNYVWALWLLSVWSCMCDCMCECIWEPHRAAANPPLKYLQCLKSESLLIALGEHYGRLFWSSCRTGDLCKDRQEFLFEERKKPGLAVDYVPCMGEEDCFDPHHCQNNSSNNNERENQFRVRRLRKGARAEVVSVGKRLRNTQEWRNTLFLTYWELSR